MFDPSLLLGAGALSGAVYAAWDHIKVYLSKIYGLFFTRLEFAEGKIKKALVIWMSSQKYTGNISLKRYVDLQDFVKPLFKTQHVAYLVPPTEPTIYWYGKTPILIHCNEDDYKITFLRWTVKPEKIIKEIMDNYNSSMGDSDETIDRFLIRKFHGTIQSKDSNNGNSRKNQVAHADHGSEPSSYPDSNNNDYYKSMQKSLKPIGWKPEEIGQIKRPDPLEYLALSPDCLEVVEEIRRWKKSEKWYLDRQIPHKKGILFYGKPGCGKSSVAKSLAMELNIPIMIFDLSNMSNMDFQDAWEEAKNNTPCMVLLEDIDAVFNGRENVMHDDGGLSFDCLLNSIDGVENADGILILATTNNIDKIDPALGKPTGDTISTRPGRIDRALELLSPDAEGRRKIGKRILKDYPDRIEEVVQAGENDTGAQFQERCSRLALQLFWMNKEKESK